MAGPTAVWSSAGRTHPTNLGADMTTDKYLRYGLAVAAGVAFAVWVGISPTLIVLFLACPLMMFFMTREMHGGPREPRLSQRPHRDCVSSGSRRCHPNDDNSQRHESQSDLQPAA